MWRTLGNSASSIECIEYRPCMIYEKIQCIPIYIGVCFEGPGYSCEHHKAEVFEWQGQGLVKQTKPDCSRNQTLEIGIVCFF